MKVTGPAISKSHYNIQNTNQWLGTAQLPDVNEIYRIGQIIDVLMANSLVIPKYYYNRTNISQLLTSSQ